MKGNQPRANLVKDENGSLLVYSHSRWKKYFCKLLNLNFISDLGRQKCICLSHYDLSLDLLMF